MVGSAQSASEGGATVQSEERGTSPVRRELPPLHVPRSAADRIVKASNNNTTLISYKVISGCRKYPANEKRHKFANLPKTGSLANYAVIFPDLTGGGEPCPRWNF